MNFWLNVLLIFVFQLIGSIFSGTEMTLVSLRESQIKQMAAQDARGRRVAKVASNPNRFLSAVQIGTTFTGFLSASFGASALTPYTNPILERWGVRPSVAQVLSTIILTLIISYFSIVISEMVPKRIAMQRTVQIARAVVPGVDVFATICAPLIWLISKLTNGLVRLFGLDPHETESQVSDDELRVLVSSNAQIGKDERTILDDVFDASDTAISEVMRPRADVTFLEADMPIAKAQAYVHGMPYSRYPVIGTDFDHVIGFVHVRDLLDISGKKVQTVRDVVRPVMQLPGTSQLLPSLTQMRKKGQHLAIVIDEYGGTDGIVTMEDMVEELIGDVRDEYDRPEESRSDATVFTNGSALVDGGMTIEDFHDVTGIELPEGPYETVAGYFLAQTGQMAKVGDSYSSPDGYDMKVVELDGRRIKTLEIIKRTDGPAGTGPHDAESQPVRGANGRKKLLPTRKSGQQRKRTLQEGKSANRYKKTRHSSRQRTNDTRRQSHIGR